MFQVIKGEFNMELRDKIITIKENEFSIVPKGVEHRPVAENEVSVLLFEPRTILKTGSYINNELTQEKLERL